MAKTTKPAATEKPVTEMKEVATVAPSGAAVLYTPPPMDVKVDIADMRRPLVKVLQGLSPEVKEMGFPDGHFFATILNEDLGTEIEATVLGYKKRYILWNPQRGVEPMVLARSEDCVLWGEGEENKEFEVQIPNVGKVKWATKGSVAESGLHLFGSSVPGNKESKPAAAVTHDFLLYLHGQDMLPVGVSLARSKLRCAESMLTIAFGGSADPRSLRLKLRAVSIKEPGKEYTNVVPLRAGKNDEETYRKMVDLSEKFKNFSLDVDLDENRGEGGGRTRTPVDMNKVEY